MITLLAQRLTKILLSVKQSNKNIKLRLSGPLMEDTLYKPVVLLHGNALYIKREREREKPIMHLE
jgi:hypothetical protein